MTTTITTAEILAELAAASVAAAGENIPPNTYSADQIRAAMHWGHVTFNREMRAMLARGEAEVVKVRKYAIDGRLSTVPAYRLTAKG